MGDHGGEVGPEGRELDQAPVILPLNGQERRAFGGDAPELEDAASSDDRNERETQELGGRQRAAAVGGGPQVIVQLGTGELHHREDQPKPKAAALALAHGPDQCRDRKRKRQGVEQEVLPSQPI